MHARSGERVASVSRALAPSPPPPCCPGGEATRPPLRFLWHGPLFQVFSGRMSKFLLTTPSLLWYITPVKKCASPSARLPLQFKSNFSGGFHVHEPLRWPFYGHTRKRPFYGHTRKRPLCSHT